MQWPGGGHLQSRFGQCRLQDLRVRIVARPRAHPADQPGQPIRHPRGAVAAIAGGQRRAQQQAAAGGHPCTGRAQQCLLWVRVQVLQHVQQQDVPGLRRQWRLHVHAVEAHVMQLDGGTLRAGDLARIHVHAQVALGAAALAQYMGEQAQPAAEVQHRLPVVRQMLQHAVVQRIAAELAAGVVVVAAAAPGLRRAERFGDQAGLRGRQGSTGQGRAVPWRAVHRLSPCRQADARQPAARARSTARTSALKDAGRPRRSSSGLRPARG